MTVGDFTERELIARIQQRLTPPPDWLLVGIGDDAAVVEPERNRVEVLTVDGLVDGVHFDRAFVPPDAIGHRALAVSLSDLAAMGATPRLALVSMALPPGLPIADFDRIADGLAALAARHRTHVVGGNLTRTPGPLTIDVTVSGGVKRRQAMTRGGAQAHDELYVTGWIGSAAAGLRALRESARSGGSGGSGGAEALFERYLRPEPRLRVGTLLARNRVASACIDLSDGLADGLHLVGAASGVGVRIESAAVPVEDAARQWFVSRGEDPVMSALAGGDDYELLFAVRPRMRRRLEAVVRHVDVPITRVGVCTGEPGATIVGRDAGVPRELPVPPGYRHFR